MALSEIQTLHMEHSTALLSEKEKGWSAMLRTCECHIAPICISRIDLTLKAFRIVFDIDVGY